MRAEAMLRRTARSVCPTKQTDANWNFLPNETEAFLDSTREKKDTSDSNLDTPRRGT
jgi:hypothetical protein